VVSRSYGSSSDDRDATVRTKGTVETASRVEVVLSGMARLRPLLRIRPFRRLWLVLGLSSLGDWLGLMATTTFATSLLASPAEKGAAFGLVVGVRLLPSLILGPIAGVIADRWDRRYTIVVTDVARFVLYASIPAANLFTADTKLALGWAAIATFAIEACAMVWAPAKDAAVPNLIPKGQFETANQLTLASTYGITPVAAGLLLALLGWALPATLGPVGKTSQFSTSHIALYFDALTFLASAVVVLFGIREISGHSDAPLAKGANPLRQFVHGWAYMAKTRLARGLALGIVGAFGAGGLVIGTANAYAVSLGAGPNTFFILIAMIFIGMGGGIVTGPRLVKALSRRRWFGLSIVLAGTSILLLALSPHLSLSVLFTTCVGVGGGMAFLAGTTLIGTEVEDAMRGRVFAFVQTAVRIVLLLTISLSSVIVGFGGSRRLSLGSLSVQISSTRMLLLAAGVFGMLGGFAALRQMDDKPGVPLLPDLISSLRGRPLGRPEPRGGHGGLLVVFEGCEGAGKTTQAELLVDQLQSAGRAVVLTQEQGATPVGARIQRLLRETAEAVTPSPRVAALLSAADRAQHAATVIRPALAEGVIVVSDRYMDSSLAYEEAGRSLPMDEISWLSRWATGGLRPDLIVLLDIDPSIGLSRVAERTSGYASENGHAPAPHPAGVVTTEARERVRYTLLDLAANEPGRYLILDATMPPEWLAQHIAERLDQMLPLPETDDVEVPATV
jgi:dTMP kinase